MNAQIGQLNGGKYYTYLNGYMAEPFIGTLEEVEAALGLREKQDAPKIKQRNAKVYTVTVRFQYPAWDEVDGIEYTGIDARSKSEANAIVRKIAADDGHLGSLKGRVTFTATEE